MERNLKKHVFEIFLLAMNLLLTLVRWRRPISADEPILIPDDFLIIPVILTLPLP